MAGNFKKQKKQKNAVLRPCPHPVCTARIRPSLEPQTFAPKMEAMMMKCRWVCALPNF